MHGATATDATPFAIERAIMREMHWSWSDLQEAPATLVDALIESIAADRYWQSKRQAMDKARQGKR